MKRLSISIDGALRVHLKRLVKGGLNGRTEREVVIRLLCEKLRELQPRDVRRTWL